MENKKWIEINIYLTKNLDTPTFKSALVKLKPFIQELYDNKVNFSWHFFREPYICLRFYAENDVVNKIQNDLDKYLYKLEENNPKIFKGHEYRPEYNGEVKYYGKDAWEAQYKLWEAGSNLALANLDSAEHPNTFHMVRVMHLVGNQFGMTRFQEGLLHLDMAIYFIKEAKLYNKVAEDLKQSQREILSDVRPMRSNI